VESELLVRVTETTATQFPQLETQLGSRDSLGLSHLTSSSRSGVTGLTAI
jgi:hypothetical protein